MKNKSFFRNLPSDKKNLESIWKLGFYYGLKTFLTIENKIEFEAWYSYNSKVFISKNFECFLLFFIVKKKLFLMSKIKRNFKVIYRILDKFIFQNNLRWIYFNP